MPGIAQAPHRLSSALVKAMFLPLLLVLLAWPAAAQQENSGVQTTWRLLDYVAVDYGEAVQGGQIVNQFEYDEMVEFSNSVSERIAALTAYSAWAGLQAGAARLPQVSDPQRSE